MRKTEIEASQAFRSIQAYRPEERYSMLLGNGQVNKALISYFNVQVTQIPEGSNRHISEEDIALSVIDGEGAGYIAILHPLDEALKEPL